MIGSRIFQAHEPLLDGHLLTHPSYQRPEAFTTILKRKHGTGFKALMALEQGRGYKPGQMPCLAHIDAP